jgi:hypothetical protein
MINYKWPPQNVKLRNGKYTYRPRISPDKQHLIPTKSGHLSPPINLGTDQDPHTLILNNLKKAKEYVASMIDPQEPDHGTIGWLHSKYIKSTDIAGLETETQISYTQRLKQLVEFPVKMDGVQCSVGSIPISSLNMPLVKTLHKKILASYRNRGFKGNHMADGLIRQLSALISWGLYEYQDFPLVGNPCIGFQKRKDKVTSKQIKDGRRYINDWEYDAQFEYACAKGYEWLPVYFELTYLLAMRSIESRLLTVDSIKPHGIEVDRKKGSSDNTILWSPRLKRAVDAALALREARAQKDTQNAHHLSHGFLISGREGALTRAAITSAMSRLKSAMKDDGLLHIYWTSHDLKRKAISDSKDKKIAGHKSEKMEQLYDTKRKEYRPPK